MSTTSFITPPITTNPSGEERRVGYEFEFTGVDMKDITEVIQSLFGGSIKQKSTYEIDVENTLFGTFTLELDAQLLRDKKYEKTLKSIGIDLTTFKNKDTIEGKLKDIASSVVPFEIITPPIPLSEMDKLNDLLHELRKWKAKGTGSSMFYAFGLHINPEISDDSPESLSNHLKAYLLLDPWIRKDAKINISRRITPYINEFKEDYKLLLLSSGYLPTLEDLISDYFIYGNSRNRPLDMLPLFMHLNKEYTENLLEDTLTSSRPTFHYRLPNCSIEDDRWSLASEWNRWVLVESLANDKKALNQYSRAYIKMQQETTIGFEQKWIKLMNRWVNDD
ncbi:MAG: amidoligase family protein [Balneolaceae bacterium]